MKDKDLTFDFTQGLMKDNLLLVDRETNSLWSQLDGKAINGPLKGTPLKAIASLQTTWKHWRELHPESMVMVKPEEGGKPYLYRNRRLGSSLPAQPARAHDTSVLGLGMTINGKSAYFPFSELERIDTPFQFELGGQDIIINYKREAFTAWGEDPKGNLLHGVLAYREGWLSFHPESIIFEAKR